LNSLAPQGGDPNTDMGKGINVTRADDEIVRGDGMLTRKQAVNFLGMNDTEFALRLIWDAEFPKAEGGSFRATEVVAWMRAWRTGAPGRALARDR
jgi:hypothetical protein